MTGGRLLEAMLAAAAAGPDRPAVTFLDRELRPRSYGFAELHRAAAELGRRLAGRVGRDAPLGILVRSQETQVLHYLAALHAGIVPAILTPPNRKLNVEYYARTTEAVLARCGFAAVVTDVDELELAVPSLAPYGLERRGGPAAPAAGRAELDGASFLQFSSGTTGIKRGVLVSDDAVLAQLATYGRAIGLGPGDVVVSWLPLYHDMGFIACLNMPLVAGVHTVMLDPVDWVTDPALFPRAVSAWRGTLAWQPNFAFAFMAERIRDRDLAGVDLSGLRLLANCSEPVTHESQRRFADRFGPLGFSQRAFRGCYAMAETTFALTDGTPDDPAYLDDVGPAGNAVLRGECQVSVGRPLEGVELRVVDDEGLDAADREIGELLVRSPFDFAGYYNDPEASAAAFDGDWYRTGDLGYRADGAYYVVGRKKDLIIVGGVNVFPHDVEELVSSVPGVTPGRVSVFAAFDPRVQTERVTILFEPARGGSESTVLEIRRHVLAAFQLAGFDVHAVEPGWLVKSSSGKMARSANRAKWLDREAVAAGA